MALRIMKKVHGVGGVSVSDVDDEDEDDHEEINNSHIQWN
jgi:hypothetical protein